MQPMSRPSVLVVEDNLENMDLLCLLLEKAGYEVFQAFNGVQGVESALRQQPDLILLDLALPEKDGWTVAAELKSDIITQSIPIVAISAHSTPESMAKAFEAGCEGFISKPFSLSVFKNEINRFFN
jgi:two-component system cell cycle response regulator DivK